MMQINSDVNEIEIKIIDAANRVFLKHGVDATTMGQIADEAGISRTSLNYYFRSKKQLFQVVLNNLENKIIPTVSKLINDENITVIEKVEIFVDEYISLIVKYPMVPAFILSEMRHEPEWIVDFFKKRNLNFEKLIKQIQTEVDEGKIKSFRLVDLMVNVIGLCVFPVLSQPILFEFFFNNTDSEFCEYMNKRKNDVKWLLRSWLSIS